MADLGAGDGGVGVQDFQEDGEGEEETTKALFVPWHAGILGTGPE